MNKKLLELEEKLDKKKTELRNLVDRINTVKEKEALPELRKMYCGKCYKYTNHGGDKSWPVYFKVLDIADIICVGEDFRSVRAKCFSFEMYPDEFERNASVFKVYHTYDFHVNFLGTEIPKSEFEKAWQNSMEKIAGMYK